MLAPTARRMASSPSDTIDREIEPRTRERVERFAREETSPFDLRLEELRAEWDVERTLQLHAGLLALGGVALAAAVDRRMAVLPAAAGALLLQHALRGWCPLVPALRRLGARTPREIEQERQALKVLRGDYARLADVRDAQTLLEAAGR